MKVVNKKFKFSFIIPDEYHEIPRKEYPRYNIHDSTLHVFVRVDEHGIPQTISMNRDDDAENEEEYLELVGLNIKNLENIGMVVTQHIHQYNKRARTDIVYSVFKGLRFATYFTSIHHMVVATSIEIKEINDEDDNTVAALFDSIEEF